MLQWFNWFAVQKFKIDILTPIPKAIVSTTVIYPQLTCPKLDPSGPGVRSSIRDCTDQMPAGLGILHLQIRDEML